MSIINSDGLNTNWQLNVLKGLQAIATEVAKPLTCAEDGVTICSPASGLNVNVHDGTGIPITSTVIGADKGLDVNIIGGVAINVNLDQNDDQVQIYGSDLTAPILTNAAGRLQVDIINIPSGLATETTLAAVNTKLTPTTRTHNAVSATGSGTVPAGSLRGSVMNVGSATGTWNGISLPAGVALPWDAVGPRDTYGAIAYNATGTTFIIEYTN